MPKLAEIALEIVDPEIYLLKGTDFKQMLKICEEAGRVSHKSENRITEDSATPFLRRVAIDMGHESILRHASITICAVMSRTCSHQWVRHNVGMAHTQESQRYCDYSVGGQPRLKVILPPSVGRLPEGTIVSGSSIYTFNSRINLLKPKQKEPEEILTVSKVGRWCLAQLRAFQAYLREREDGIPAEDARYHLTGATKTEIYTTMNLEACRHFITMRGAKEAQWEIRWLARTLGVLLGWSSIGPLFEDVGKVVKLLPHEQRAIWGSSDTLEADDCTKLTKTQKLILEKKLWRIKGCVPSLRKSEMQKSE